MSCAGSWRPASRRRMCFVTHGGFTAALPARSSMRVLLGVDRRRSNGSGGCSASSNSCAGGGSCSSGCGGGGCGGWVGADRFERLAPRAGGVDSRRLRSRRDVVEATDDLVPDASRAELGALRTLFVVQTALTLHGVGLPASPRPSINVGCKARRVVDHVRPAYWSEIWLGAQAASRSAISRRPPRRCDVAGKHCAMRSGVGWGTGAAPPENVRPSSSRR